MVDKSFLPDYVSGMKVRFKKYDALLALSKFKPHPKNRNTHPEEQIKRLAEIMKYQGVRAPITVSKRSGFITRGHGRLAAAKLNKWKEFPVVYQDYDSAEQEYADLQADNAIASWAELDLSAIRADLPSMKLDLEMLGLDESAILLLKQKVEEVNKGDENSAWAQMGEEHEFKEGKGYTSLIIHFKTEKAREKFVADKALSVSRKSKAAWIVLP